VSFQFCIDSELALTISDTGISVVNRLIDQRALSG